tara:strand:- start:9423 stop:9566 length:144 start_codon:yes stop_codon:yes gene_type:complete
MSYKEEFTEDIILGDIISFDMSLMPGEDEVPSVGGEDPDDDDEEAEA